MLGYALAIFALGCLGGIVPLFVRRTERVLHLLIAFSTGIFLGVVFQHLLPEVAHLSAQEAALHAEHDHGHGDHGHDAHADEHAHPEAEHEHGAGDHAHGVLALEPEVHAHAHSSLWLWMLGGLLALYFLEHLVFGGHEHHGHGASAKREHHATIGWASLFGLSIHALTAGMMLAAAHLELGVGTIVFFCIISHKAAETFSLGTVFLLAGSTARTTLLVILGFSLVTPLGMFIGAEIIGLLPPGGVAVLAALSAGTFLFVALCDLLPEVFHDRKDVLARVALVITGVVVSVLVHAGGAA
ncbi:MAG: ZIP family metal transporter [Planctomycetota bacterium]